MTTRCIPVFQPSTPPFVFADAIGVIAPPLGGLGYTPNCAYNLQYANGAGGGWVNTAFNADIYRYYPMVTVAPGSFRSLQFYLLVAGGVGCIVRVGLYTDRDERPDQLIFDAGETDGNATGFYEFFLPERLTLGAGQTIWGVIIVSTGTPSFGTPPSYAPPFGWSPTGSFPGARYCRAVAQAYGGALPQTAIPPTTFWIEVPCPLFLRTFA